MNSTKASKILTFLSIFPANAGVFPRSLCVSRSSQNIPRERGGQPIIRNRGVLAAVYSPRTRGGHPLFERLTFKVTGYSPRTRGSTCVSVFTRCGLPIFPANAGVNPINFLFFSLAGYIPRERGGLPQKSEKMTFTIEYSPRTRGSSHRAEVRHEIHHIPRERGGLPGSAHKCIDYVRYSPRTRGSTL